MTNNIVTIHNDVPVAGTYLIAQGFKRKHNTIVKLILKHEEHFITLNNKPFLKRLIINKVPAKTAGRPVEEYLLNEDQTMFLGTLFNNSKIVVQFKLNLVKSFSKTRKQLAALQAHQSTDQYKIARDAGKLVRREATDVIQQFVIYAEAQGSRNAKRYYTSITSMVNKSLFTTHGKFKNLRNAMSVKQLMAIATVEQIVDNALIEGMALNKPYSEIYQDAKAKVAAFVGAYGQSDIVDAHMLSHTSTTNQLAGVQ